MLPPFHRNYAGLFVAQSGPDVSVFGVEPSVGVWMFASPESTRTFLVAGEHPEPLTRCLREAHRAVSGTSMLAGLLTLGERWPSESHSYLFQFPASSVSVEAVEEMLNDDSFILFLPHSSEIVALTTGTVGLAWLKRYPTLRAETGLVLINARPPQPTSKSKAARPYDPIASQIREVAGPVAEATLHAVEDLRTRWISVFGGDIPEELALLPSVLEEKTANLHVLVRNTGSIDQRILLSEVDRYAHGVKEVAHYVRELASKMEAHQPPATPPSQHTYEQFVSRVMLRAARNYVTDVARRIGIDTAFFPFFGQTHMLQPLAFARLLDVPSSKPQSFVVYLPDETRLRLGSLPILAHEIAHTVVDAASRQTLDLIQSRQRDPTMEAAFEAIQMYDGASTFDEEEKYARDMDIATRWSQEILCDLIATHAVGSSFVFAFSRFLTGTLGEYSGNRGSGGLSLHPPLAARLRLCLALLAATGDTTFRSEYFAEPVEPLHSYFVDMIRTFVREPASTPDPAHRRSLARRQSSSCSTN